MSPDLAVVVVEEYVMNHNEEYIRFLGCPRGLWALWELSLESQRMGFRIERFYSIRHGWCGPGGFWGC